MLSFGPIEKFEDLIGGLFVDNFETISVDIIFHLSPDSYLSGL